MKLRKFFGYILLGIILVGCSTGPGAPVSSGAQDGLSGGNSGKLNVVTTTTIVGDVVRNIGGNTINLIVLIPANVDEHGYEPTPQDAAKASHAAVIFMNGAGLEQFMARLVQTAGGKATVVTVSDGIQLLQSPANEEGTAAKGQTGDPHVWTDPNNVLVWVDNIEKALAAADPKHAANYQQNADSYRQQLRDLDSWIKQQVEQVKPDRRKLVTDHLVFTYFANRYGFEQVGAVVPGYSTVSAPSAQELAALEDHIRKLGVPVIFVGNTVNPAMAERVAQDTHTKLVHILTGSLTNASGPAPTYIDYIKYNVKAIVGALK